MTDPRDKRDGDPPGPGRRGAYGVSDFAGGVLTRRAHVLVVALVAAYLLREGRDWRAVDGGEGL